MPFSSNLSSGGEAEFGREVPVCWNSKQRSWNGNKYWDIEHTIALHDSTIATRV